jgi:protein TonB
MALSDFIPYGAPELLEGASARLARSTLAASLTVALLVATMGAILTRGFTRAPELPAGVGPIELLPPPPIEVLPEPKLPEQTPVAPPRESLDPHARPELVPDRIAPPEAPPLPRTGTQGEAPGEGPISPSTGTRASGEPVALDPGLTEFVPVDEYPVLVRCADAHYPDLARSAGVEGTVRLQLLVGLDGRVERVIVVPKGSVPMLDDAALASARTCVFTPALTNGRPVKVWVSRSYRFTLH